MSSCKIRNHHIASDIYLVNNALLLYNMQLAVKVDMALACKIRRKHMESDIYLVK
jgi:hypothetical protein